MKLQKNKIKSQKVQLVSVLMETEEEAGERMPLHIVQVVQSISIPVTLYGLLFSWSLSFTAPVLSLCMIDH